MVSVVMDMRYYRRDKGGYLHSIGTGNGGTEITAEQYAEIQRVIASKPDGDYLLTSSLEWEAYTPEPAEPDPTSEELLSILLGGESE